MVVNSSSNSANVPSKSRFTEYNSNQDRLPYWARSTNPIVRRHLGLYWRTIPPEFKPYLIIFGIWVAIMIVGVLVPPFLALTMISYLASIMIIPFAMALYAYVLLNIAIDSTRAMQQEFANNTFQLLQATPMSLTQILLGKVAAGIWRRMDDLVMIAQLALAFTPPIAFTIYSDFWSFGEHGLILAPTVTLLAALTALGRVFLEPIMVGVISVFIGVVVPGKGRSITASVVICGFYYLLINLLSRLPSVRGFESPDGPVPPNLSLVFLMDIVLPVVLPLVVIFGVLKLAESMLAQD